MSLPPIHIFFFTTVNVFNAHYKINFRVTEKQSYSKSTLSQKLTFVGKQKLELLKRFWLQTIRRSKRGCCASVIFCGKMFPTNV